MKNFLGVLLALGWVAVFSSPLAIMYWSLADGPWVIATRTGWPLWVSFIASIVGALVVTTPVILFVWPKLLGSGTPQWSRHDTITLPAPSREIPSEPMFTTVTVSTREPDPEPPVLTPRREVYSDEQLRGIYSEAATLSEAGEHDEAIRRLSPLQVEDIDRLGNPHLGCMWEVLEKSADRAADRSATRFAYSLMVEQASWELTNATASGEARSAQENIRRIQTKN
jgi:hypothetical protein